MPFNDGKLPSKKKGLKIDNQTSSVPQPKPNPVAAFEQQAQQAFDKYEEYKQRTWTLSTRFKSLIEDKTIPENKTLISKDLEKEILDGLITLASDMNADDNQPEGVGAVALSMLLMKMLLLQRDTMNALSYKVEKLSSRLEQILKVSNEVKDK